MQTTFNGFLCHKGHLHFSNVLEDGFLGKDVVITD